MSTPTRLRESIDEMMPGVVADRRHLHEHPELGFHEVETARFVAERLQALGVEDIRTGIAETGVTGVIRGGQGAGKTVLLRADMDALPIVEENDVPYRSRHDGVMHACGHDGHTAMLLGVARVLTERKDDFTGTVKLLFQPAEEMPPGGAKPMIEAGVLDDPPVDAVFGIHLDQDAPVGKVSLAGGPVMAAADRFTVVIKGKGGHGAKPQTAIDPIAVGSQIVVALQTLISREYDPVATGVVSVCAFLSGSAFNVIPDTAELRGTVRTFTAENRAMLSERIPELVRGIAAAMRAEAEVTYDFGYPASINDPAMTDLVREVVTEVVGAENVIAAEPQMGAEDFSYFLERRPGSFFFIGSNNAERDLTWSHHHPRFDIDEAALAIGIESVAKTALRYLET
ncbi:MAG: amidohydrolase [Chloroflexota bacterium]|nr:amidohydrolase [Chloroflexota bacterium]